VDSAASPPDARRAVRHRLGLAPGCFLLVFFGFVHPVKGLRYLLEALPQVRAARPDLHLVTIGGFTSQALPQRQAREFRAQLEAECEQHAVADAVTFTGYLPPAQVSEILHAADAGVLPFTTGVTTKSGALLALLAHGVPTAVTVADQPDERLRDGETVAVIHRRRDPPAIAVTVHRLVSDPALRQRLGTGGQRLLAGRSWRDVADAHRALYERVLGRAHG
jgi:glycosyltransferase involved in cell wall biosynthesis